VDISCKEDQAAAKKKEEGKARWKYRLVGWDPLPKIKCNPAAFKLHYLLQQLGTEALTKTHTTARLSLIQHLACYPVLHPTDI